MRDDMVCVANPCLAGLQLALPEPPPPLSDRERLGAQNYSPWSHEQEVHLEHRRRVVADGSTHRYGPRSQEFPYEFSDLFNR